MLRALFVCFAIAVLSESILQAAGALAVAALARQGIAATASAFGDGAQRAQGAIAAAIAQGETPPAAVPSPAPTCVLSSGSACALIATESIVLATPSAAPCPSVGCAGYEQENDVVGEGRVVATIEALVSNAQGTPVAARSGTLVFRTLRVAPYAVFTGALDATLDDDEGGAGDLGGLVPAGSSAGTLIDVVYQNASSGAVMPANVWSGLAPTTLSSSSWSP